MRIIPTLLRIPTNVIQVKLLKKFSPLRVLHFVTFRCNLRCKYCGIWKVKTHELNSSEIKRFMVAFRRKGVVFWTFTGGEPLIRSDIGELVRFAKNVFPLVSLTTNGTLLKQKFQEIKDVDYLTVSLDGPEKINDTLRGKGVYKKVVEGIKEVRKYGKKVVINTVLSKENLKNNLEGLKNVIKLALKLGCKFNFNIMYSDQFNQGYISDGSGSLSQIFPTEEEFRKGIRFIIQLKKRLGNFIQPSLKTIEHMSTTHKWRICYAGKAFVDLFPDGKIIPCLFKEQFGRKIKSNNLTVDLPPFYNCRCVSECYSELNVLMNFDIKALLQNLKKGVER